MPPPILAHIHLRKCGGTAFAQLLERHFGSRHARLYADDIYFVYSVPELERELARTADLAAFSSHHVRSFPPALLGRPVHYVTFLRDPVRQFVSYMTHARKHYGEFTHPSLLQSLPPDAPQLSLREFARWILTRERDVLFRENYTVDFLARYNPGPGTRLSRAKTILNDFFFVGITERMDESLRKLRRLADAQGLEFPCGPLRLVNASSEPGDDLNWIHPEDEVGALLLDSVCEDRQLYEWALSRQLPAPLAPAHPLRALIENIQRDGVPGEFRAAGVDGGDAAAMLRTIHRPAHSQIALLWLAGDADALRSGYPRISAGGYVFADQYRASERCRAEVDNFRAEWDIREPLIPIGSAGVCWRVAEAVPQALPRPCSQEPAIESLLQVYAARPDLQEAFPETAAGDCKRIIGWARHAARGDFPDSSADLLQPYREWYELNAVDDAWPLLEAACALAANPLPAILRGQRSEPHVMVLALLIIEFGLRDIVVQAPCGALKEAAESIGGRMRCLEPGASEIAGPIDLLYLNSLPLYSQTLAALRGFGPYLHEGAWIALPQTIASPGVTQALVEAMESFGWKPRIYPFIEQGGLILLRVSR
jgi:Macrocin-O-methyltransferase (TylF)